MNNVCGYGRTRTHLILLSALAVLCIAIVCVCVFSNLNALATNNIAYADEEGPSRYISNTGFANANFLTHNYCVNWSGTYSSTGSEVIIYEDTYYRYCIKSSTSCSLSNNVFSGSDGSLIIYIKDNSLFTSPDAYTEYTIAVGTISRSASSYKFEYWRDTSRLSNYNANTTTYGIYYGGFRSGTIVNNDFVVITFGGSFSVTLRFLYLSTGTYFAGYVNPDYVYIDSSGSGSSIPDFTNSTGLVGDNILQYSYFDDATFNQDVSSSSFTDIWVSVDNTQSIKLAYGSIRDNVISCDGLESRAYTDLRFSVPLMTRPYVIACYVTDIVGNWGLLVNGLGSSADIVLQEGLNVLYIPELSREETRAATTDIDIYVSQASGRSITLHWIKLERGTAFTGYVAPDNANSYESGYEQGLIDGYYNGITDLNSMREVLVNVDLQTKGPYYVVNKSDTPYGVNNDYYDITWSISDSISGVTYGSYIPVIFNLGYTVPIGLDLIWKFDGVLLNPHSSAVDPNGSSTIYYGFYNSTSFVTYGPEYAPYQDIITWPNGEVNQLVFHATYSGCFLILWFYTDSTNPYYEFGIRTPVVDGSYNSIPYTFEFNPYTVTDSTENLDNARQQGYNQGFTRGYNQGKYENANSSGYTFSALLGSVFDAPITALLGSKKYDEITGNYIGREGGLLNFEILGVNLGGFVIGLLSLAIILFILRVFMRGL